MSIGVRFSSGLQFARAFLRCQRVSRWRIASYHLCENEVRYLLIRVTADWADCAEIFLGEYPQGVG